MTLPQPEPDEQAHMARQLERRKQQLEHILKTEPSIPLRRTAESELLAITEPQRNAA